MKFKGHIDTFKTMIGTLKGKGRFVNAKYQIRDKSRFGGSGTQFCLN